MDPDAWLAVIHEAQEAARTLAPWAAPIGAWLGGRRGVAEVAAALEHLGLRVTHLERHTGLRDGHNPPEPKDP